MGFFPFFLCFLTWNRVLLTFDPCGLLCSTLRRFITSRHDVGARRDFVFSFLGLELEHSRQKSSFILYHGPLRPLSIPIRTPARTLCTMIIIYMTCLHHVSQLDPLDLNRTRTLARPSFYFLFVLIGSDIAFFYRQLESPNPITRPSLSSPARPLTRLSVFTWPSPCFILCLLALRLFCFIFHLPISLHPLIYLSLFFFFCFTSVIDSESGSPLHFLSTLSHDNGLSFSGFSPPPFFPLFPP